MSRKQTTSKLLRQEQTTQFTLYPSLPPFYLDFCSQFSISFLILAIKNTRLYQHSWSCINFLGFEMKLYIIVQTKHSFPKSFSAQTQVITIYKLEQMHPMLFQMFLKFLWLPHSNWMMERLNENIKQRMKTLTKHER